VNRELKRVSVFVLAMFVALFVAASVIQVVSAPTLQADPRNARTIIASYSAERGAILVDGTPIASSVPVEDRYKFLRTYAQPDLYSAVTGYYTLGQGATGIEDSMNDVLSGTSGTQFFDSLTRTFTGQDPKGASVELTIDPKVQQAAYDALGKLQGSVVAIEPSTGKVLAMVSKPGYDPNALASHDRKAVQQTYSSLLKDPANPLIDRAVNSLNPPGSTFKLITTAAALESGQYTPDSLLPNPATFTLPGTSTVITNAGEGACGSEPEVSIATALRLSCNIPFAQLGIALGSERIAKMAEAFGYGKSIDVPMKSAKSVFSPDLDDAQTAQSAFGQLDVRATPLQTAMVTAGIANGGEVMKPSVVESVLNPDLSELSGFTPSGFADPISKETAATMTRMMIDDVQSGVASNARISGVDVAGKTGTAQNGADDPYTLWFTGFAPADSPKVAVAVLVEDGGGRGRTGSGNTLAAPVAKKVIEAVLDR
jgi:peptidoglycan glycosyltransferase